MQKNAFIAANSNLPLWKSAALFLIENGPMDELRANQRDALLEQAIASMKPSPQARRELAASREQENAFLLTFVQAYKTGLRPMAGLSERTIRLSE